MGASASSTAKAYKSEAERRSAERNAAPVLLFGVRCSGKTTLSRAARLYVLSSMRSVVARCHLNARAHLIFLVCVIGT
jgi:hypothetical protein